LKLHRRISKTAVVFVTYGNRHHYFSKLIERLFSMGVEFIIAVDNNSHSESKETLLKYSSGKKLKLCIIENSQNLGSAAFFEDVPIPDEYKFEDKKENIPKIVEKIKDCFENFEEEIKKFAKYREIIKNEQSKFIDDLKNIFQVNQ